MNPNPFEAFITLVELDRTHQALLKHILEAKTKIQQQYKRLEEAQANQASKEFLLKKKRLELADLQQQLLTHEKRLKDKQQAPADNRSYKAAQLEIAHLEKENKRIEEAIFSFFEQIEALEKSVNVQKEAIVPMRLEVEKEQQQFDVLEKTITQQIQEITAKRTLVSLDIEPGLFKDYEHMFERVKNPAAEITGTSCAACFAILSAHDLMRAKNHARVNCKNCYRLLYLPPSQ